MKKRFLRTLPFLILTLLCTVFIFSNSMTEGEESALQSGRVVRAVMKVCDAVGIEVTDTDTLTYNVRKSAHFLEFGLLGMLSFFTLIAFNIKALKSAAVSLFYCGTVAATDEYIQTFYEGRAGHIGDVLIDLSGALTIIVICFIIVLIIKKRYIKFYSERDTETD